MIDAIIFDLFGTLIHLRRDSNPYLQLCRAIGNASRIRESLVTDAPTLAVFCDHIGEAHPENIASIQRDLDSDVAEAALFDDAIPTLRLLRQRGIRIGLISNLASPYKRAFFNLGLDDLIDVAVFSCDVGHAKPAREVYHRALQILNLPAESALMIGDSPRSDVDGPMACGIRGVLLDRSGSESGDSCLQALSDVTSILSS